MLPFLKAKKQSSVVMMPVSADGKSGPSQPEDEKNPKLVKAAESIISAVGAKDALALAEALEMLLGHEEEPSEEA